MTPFAVECEEPFIVEPRDGVLEPFSTLTLTATFKPKVSFIIMIIRPSQFNLYSDDFCGHTTVVGT